MKIDFDDFSHRECYQLLTGMILPRPIAWISTVGEDGTFNLAPFSFFTGITSKPPLICISIGSRKGEKKDTLKNIEFARDFVINIVDESLAQKMNQTSADYQPNVSEFEETGLTPLPSDKVKSPRLAESPVNMECQLEQILTFGESPQVSDLVIGEVVRAHVKDTLFRDAAIDAAGLGAIGRLSGDQYCRVQDIFEMKRPSL